MGLFSWHQLYPEAFVKFSWTRGSEQVHCGMEKSNAMGMFPLQHNPSWLRYGDSFWLAGWEERHELKLGDYIRWDDHAFRAERKSEMIQAIIVMPIHVVFT